MATEISSNSQQGRSRQNSSTGRISGPVGPGGSSGVSGPRFSQNSNSNERDSDEDRASGVTHDNRVARRIACDVCRERKIRCDRGQPQCGRCGRLGHRCRYTASKRQEAFKLDVPQVLLTLHARLGKSPERCGLFGSAIPGKCFAMIKA